MALRDNAKSPKAYYDDGKSDPTYPYISGHADEIGGSFSRYVNPEKPKEAYEQTIRHNGGIEIYQANDENGLVNTINPGEQRDYISGGSSKSVEGHASNSSDSSKETIAFLDQQIQTGGTRYVGTGDTDVGGSQNSGYRHKAVGGESYETTSGNVITHHEGDRNNNTEGDTVNTYVGNKYTIVSKSSDKGVGEYGIHVQDGNMDTQLDAGKYRVFSAQDMTMISSTKLTLQVGSSTIVMEPGKITITSADVEFVKAT